MIGSYLMKNNLKLLKVIKGTKSTCTPRDAIDGIAVTRDVMTIGTNGVPMIKNIHRARPYYAKGYESSFCDEAPNCDLECLKCYQADNDSRYWDGFDIGFPTGAVNNILVFDIDPRNIPGFKDLKTTMNKLELAYGPLPKTWTVDTPSGGLHLYYKCNVKFAKDTTIPGIDILGTGFWVKLPPYTNKAGIAYKWKYAPGMVELADCPVWLRNRVSLNKVRLADKSKLSPIPREFTSSDSETRELIRKKLAMMPISLFRHGEQAHERWVRIGQILCSHKNSHLGTEDLFLEWCRTDSEGELSQSQLQHFRNGEHSHIGGFFNIVKEVLG